MDPKQNTEEKNHDKSSLKQTNKSETKSRHQSIVIVQDAETKQIVSPHHYKGRYSTKYDETHGWPPTPEDQILDWTHFTMNITSDEVSAEYVLEKIIPQYGEEWIDFRPYMCENPIKIQTETTLQHALELFDNLHLRHLIVV